MSLVNLETGKRGVVARIDGGLSLHSKLIGLGIVPGVSVRMIQGGNHGPVLVEVLGCRLMLGAGMARKVILG